MYSEGGTYTVTLTVTDSDSCIDVKSEIIDIEESPLADFTHEGNCDGEPIYFTDLSSPNGGSVIIIWFWEFDDPASGTSNTSTLQNPAHIFSAPGTYNVILVTQNIAGCTDTIIKPVEIDPFWLPIEVCSVCESAE